MHRSPVFDTEAWLALLQEHALLLCVLLILCFTLGPVKLFFIPFKNPFKKYSNNPYFFRDLSVLLIFHRCRKAVGTIPFCQFPCNNGETRQIYSSARKCRFQNSISRTHSIQWRSICGSRTKCRVLYSRPQ